MPNESSLASLEFAAQYSEKDYQIVQEDTQRLLRRFHREGDVLHLQPALPFNTGGKVSVLHSVDFDIVERSLPMWSCKNLRLSAYRLLSGRAVKAKDIVAKLSQPIFTMRSIYNI